MQAVVGVGGDHELALSHALQDLTRLHRFGRLLDIAIGQLADVDKSILVNSNIDESPPNLPRRSSQAKYST